MAFNRLSRDQIVSNALDMVESPALNHKDRPGGILHQNALSLAWLQEGIDYIHRKYPYGAQLATTTTALSAGSVTITLPSDYLLDVRDGLRLEDTSNNHVLIRLKKRTWSWYLNQDTGISASRGIPHSYIIKGSTLFMFPAADKGYSAKFWYYKLPEALSANSVPDFPDDFTLVEYVRLRGQEWVGLVPAGSAMTYAESIVASLRASGLGQEAEITDFPLDRSVYRPSGNNQYDNSSWLGSTVPN